MSASAPVRSALVLERELVAPLLSPWVVPRDILRLGTTSRGCLQAVRNGMEALNVADRDLAQSDSRSGYNVLTDAHVITYDIVFFHLYENVEGIIRSRKELMRNTFDFMDEPKRVPQEVCDELGIQLPEPESDY